MDGYKTLHGRYVLVLGPRQMDCLRIMLYATGLSDSPSRYMNGEDRDPMEQMTHTVGSLLGEPVFEGEEITPYARLGVEGGEAARRGRR